MNNLSIINLWLENTESSIVQLVSGFSPWVAPLIPAYLSYRHTIEFLDFPIWLGITAGITIESLGMATVSTALMFYRHNKRYKTETKKSPTWIAVASYIFYLVSVLLVNVILSLGHYTTSELITIALLVLLSLPAVLIIAIRSQHFEIVNEIKTKNAERRENRKPKIEKKRTFTNDWRKLSENDKKFLKDKSIEEMVNYGINERTAYNWKKKLVTAQAE